MFQHFNNAEQSEEFLTEVSFKLIPTSSWRWFEQTVFVLHSTNIESDQSCIAPNIRVKQIARKGANNKSERIKNSELNLLCRIDKFWKCNLGCKTQPTAMIRRDKTGSDEYLEFRHSTRHYTHKRLESGRETPPRVVCSATGIQLSSTADWGISCSSAGVQLREAVLGALLCGLVKDTVSQLCSCDRSFIMSIRHLETEVDLKHWHKGLTRHLKQITSCWPIK